MKLIRNNLNYIVFTFLSFISIYRHLNSLLSNVWIYIIDIIVIFLLFIFYKKLYNNIKLDKKYNIFIFIMSFIFVLGYSYEIKSTGELFWGNILISLIKIMGYYFFFKTLIYYFIRFSKKEYVCKNKFVLKFSEHPYRYSFIFLSICYGIFLVLYYPGIINYDNANQIKEMMGMHTRYLDAINPISDSTLTNFNPILHTFMLGGLFKFGYLIGSVNFGMFLYSYNYNYICF